MAINRVVLASMLSVFAFALTGCREKDTKPTPSATTSASTAATTVTAATWKVGDKVDVEWKGGWWQGKILAVSGDKYKVHYVGWSSRWDEEVLASRLRAPTASAQKGTEADGETPAAASAAAGSGGADAIPEIPEGRSKPPTVAEWAAAPNVNTQEANSQPEGCYMKVVREWLKVNCEGKITEVKEMQEFGNENADYFQSVTPGKSADFVVRLRKGKTMKLKILRSEKGNASLFVNWPATAAKPTIIALGRSN